MNRYQSAATYLVIGAAGAQGGAVAGELSRRGLRVRGFGRRHEPALPAVEWVGGDLSDADALAAAFKGVTHASVTLPVPVDAERSEQWVRNVAAAAADARVERLVFNTSNRFPGRTTSVEIFESRRLATSSLLGSDLPVVVLRPPVYLENLLAPGVVSTGPDGATVSYPLAAERRVAWLSHDDLAALTVAAFGKDDLVGTAVDVGGANAVSGPELATAFSSVTGTDATYQALPVGAFEAGLAAVMDPASAARVAATYRWVDDTGADLYDGAPEKVEETFGVRLTPLRDWIAARSWDAR